ncbi:Hpt domain-containing protein [Marixanthomonas sp. SCSIO 43207]|uniref:Hpt domain-containing protein n=1 Tax=Marixanthomonas sp. SCSIO 43207 TaxID=2779360 RepID=UPI001CA7EE66|nr:Hpt domain-containing protein [Marixanthomonas sp. SCSIO 43207]UAB80190.1 Hpt domain-containing protein [Marixanthomonas sp. SCSIO 43207]
MSKHYSIEKIQEIAGGDEDFMAVVAQTFLDEIPPDLEALQEAVSNNNKELAYQFAHKMKPNFEMFGVEINKEILAIESWTKTSKKQSAIESKLETVVTTVKEVIKELKEDFNL